MTRIATKQAPGLRTLAALLLLCITGCGHTAQPQPLEGHATCPVCMKHGDMACEDVVITSTTPQASYKGKLYYFCSPECREEFLANPEKFVN